MTLSSFTVPERISITWFFGIFFYVCLLLRTGSASAHAIVVESVPAVNAQVSGPDVHIDMRFNSRIDHGRSSLVITDSGGQKTRVPIAKDAPPDHILATVKNVAPGKCIMEWRVLSLDGHLTRGQIPFTITAP